MSSRVFLWLTFVLALIALALGIAAQGPSTTVHKSAISPAVVRQAKQQQVLQANGPASACNPAVGQGVMGVCAPRVPFNPLLGSQKVIHGILGVDVSSYQGCGNTFTGVSFVITKFNEGVGYRDACATHNISVALQKHLPNGGYDFLRPGSQSAQAEAGLFVSMYRSTGANGVAVADVEANTHGLSRGQMQAYVCTWVSTVHQNLPAVKIVIYTGGWFWTPQVGGKGCSDILWVSAYADSYSVPVGFSHATLWQYSDGVYGPVPHINRWDSDVFLGSKSQFDTLFSSVQPIPGWAKRDCTQLAYLKKKSAAIHKKTHGWLGPKDHAKKVHDQKVLAKNYTCDSNGNVGRK